MRTRHWLAALMSGCMALAGVGTTSAQPPMMPSNGNPDQAGLGMLPAPYNNSYGPSQQSYAGMEAAGYPPGANAWPNVSPFAGPPVDSTAYEDGFWFNRVLQGNRKYYFSAEALYGHTGKGKETLIGAPGVNPQSTDGQTGRLGGIQGNTIATLLGLTQFNQNISLLGPFRSLTVVSGGGGGGGNNTASSVNVFGAQSTGVLANQLISGGFRGTFGWFNSDDSGFVLSGFAQSKATSRFDLQDDQLFNPDNGLFNPFHLHAWYGLPLGSSGTGILGAPIVTTGPFGKVVTPDGDTDGDTLYGAVIPYDMGVHISFTTALMGGNSDWYFNSIYEAKSVKVRPLAGARYLHLRETFNFDAFDSGLGYTINNLATGAGGGGGGGNGQTTTGQGFLTPTAFQTLFSTPNVLHSHLSSTDLSQMAGPEAGFRVDLGGKKFQMWGQTKFGALANVTARQITGYGIGNNFNIISPNTVPVMPNDPSRTAFSTTKTTTSMSPMFEQSINVKLPVFNLIPYLNKLEIFETAQLQAGYTFLYVGDVYRPHNTIIFNQYPKTPQLNGQKSDFFNQNFNLGVEWNY